MSKKNSKTVQILAILAVIALLISPLLALLNY